MLAQVIKQKKNNRNTHRNHISLLMKNVRTTSCNSHQFMQVALKVMFLSPQMSAKIGIKVLGQRTVAAMIRKFEQLDQGAFLGKLVVDLVHMEDLTEEEICLGHSKNKLLHE